LSAPTEEFQIAVAAALLAASAVIQVAAATDDGPAVFAEHQDFDFNAFPRVTIEPPQMNDLTNGCSRGWEAIVTTHSWARGSEASLEAGRLAGAVEDALHARLALPGFKVITFSFQGSRPVGDPDPAVEHIVSAFRYIVRPAA
jgi:hypothetical protein